MQRDIGGRDGVRRGRRSTDNIPIYDETVRAAVAEIAATLNTALANPSMEAITLTRDEALLTLGLVDGLVSLFVQGNAT